VPVLCAVGYGQLVYTRAGEVVDIEGNPRSPINQGTLCPKGASSRQLVRAPGRLTKVKYRRPGATEWEELGLEHAMDMIAERVIAARENGWQDTDRHGWRVDRTLGFAHLGGADVGARRRGGGSRGADQQARETACAVHRPVAAAAAEPGEASVRGGGQAREPRDRAAVGVKQPRSARRATTSPDPL
jgi:anaerobic selenocysteine-containing dehydrogenase